MAAWNMKLARERRHPLPRHHPLYRRKLELSAEHTAFALGHRSLLENCPLFLCLMLGVHSTHANARRFRAPGAIPTVDFLLHHFRRLAKDDAVKSLLRNAATRRLPRHIGVLSSNPQALQRYTRRRPCRRSMRIGVLHWPQFGSPVKDKPMWRSCASIRLVASPPASPAPMIGSRFSIVQPQRYKMALLRPSPA